MNDDRESDQPEDAMAAIRALVEANRESLAGLDASLDDAVLELDDVVWRSPSRVAIDPAETITRLAEEADKVALGAENPPPQAAILRQAPDLVSDPGPSRAEARADTDRRPPSFSIDEAESAIRALLTESLREQGKIDSTGRITIPEEELKAMVRAQIDSWLATHSHDEVRDALRERADLRKTSAQQSPRDQD
ncbi:MAG: hypothetical protein ACPG7P_06720 [Candidatus Puniceispirillaceae bacterium]|jgi:hypothetical protein